MLDHYARKRKIKIRKNKGKVFCDYKLRNEAARLRQERELKKKEKREKKLLMRADCVVCTDGEDVIID